LVVEPSHILVVTSFTHSLHLEPCRLRPCCWQVTLLPLAAVAVAQITVLLAAAAAC
jgi:hypothetical protein